MIPTTRPATAVAPPFDHAVAQGVGPDELVDYWPLVTRAAWFFGGMLVVVLVGWYVVEPAVRRAIDRRNRNNPTLREAVSRYVRLLSLVGGVAVGGGVAGYGDVLADSALIVAAGTLAVGVAGQQVLGSLVSGLVLVADPQFNVGNRIEWDGGERGGTVESITLRVTRVRTPNGELVTIPNTVLTSQPVTRPYGGRGYRIVERIELAYEDSVDGAIGHLEAAAEGLDGVLAEPPPAAHVDDLGGSAVVFRVDYWIGNPRRRDVVRVRSAYARAVKARLEAAGYTISPASQRELSGRIRLDESG